MVARSEVEYQPPDDTPLAALAARQHGVVSRAQLSCLGYSVQALKTRAGTGRLHRLHRGVYAVGHTRLTVRGRWLAAVLACGDGAFLSHRAAAALHDLIPVGGGDIDVTGPSRRTIPGIHSHASRLIVAGSDTTILDAIPVATVSRTLLDLAGLSTVSAQRLRSIAEQAQRCGRLDLRGLDDVLGRAGGRAGVTRLRAVLAELDDEPPWIQSPAEGALLELVRVARLPEPRTNVLVAGRLVDAYWPAQRLVVEIDGWMWHRDRRAFETDRRRDTELALIGVRTVRVTARRLTDEPAGVARDLARLLSAA